MAAFRAPRPVSAIETAVEVAALGIFVAGMGCLVGIIVFTASYLI